ncbi:SIR2 family NAD-dependent protein deacylase [Prosthecodimorpha staleyi]|uniref:protein acetyllysine N-acetyltransferase n=1 Tax=Prosthecodimorpha staleyi TaxID=2840188 RepID=A0A947GAX8_9HYPH|nr:Sir2 family NAD-dependent protein deacetylase [Prosthecodimorpha staleyi]MBT9288092.1 Sir2 family NAD-dependent protein deacetylase [Prosthecodimorpha staleyi]
MNIVSDLAEGRRILAEAIGAAKRLVLFTGAGVSTESGIPDFRSPGGLWSRMRPITFQDFVASEAARLEDWRRRFHLMAEFEAAIPNAGHRAMARLVGSGKAIALITQNIDGLHERSGVPEDRLIRLHGTGTHASCLDCHERMEIAEAEAAIAATGQSPRCPACGGLIKCAVVSFGQAMPEAEMTRAEAASRAADLFVAAGSSLQVHPAAGLPVAARRAGARLLIVNRDETALDSLADRVLRGPIGRLFDPSDDAGRDGAP